MLFKILEVFILYPLNNILINLNIFYIKLFKKYYYEY